MPETPCPSTSTRSYFPSLPRAIFHLGRLRRGRMSLDYFEDMVIDDIDVSLGVDGYPFGTTQSLTIRDCCDSSSGGGVLVDSAGASQSHVEVALRIGRVVTVLGRIGSRYRSAELAAHHPFRRD